MRATPEADDCPKCGAWLNGMWLSDHMDDCPYEHCDDPTCLALKEPLTDDECRTALNHWKTHAYLGGCAHSR